KESLKKPSGSAEQQSLERKGCGPHATHAYATKNAAVAHTASLGGSVERSDSLLAARSVNLEEGDEDWDVAGATNDS
ncbi:hypothetical protein GW17_00055199, partial [Ensete ventricosum]